MYIDRDEHLKYKSKASLFFPVRGRGEFMNMEAILEAVFSQNGLLAALFVGVLIWVLKTNDMRETRLVNQNDEREKRYINTIDNITTKVGDKISKIEDDIGEIKESVKKEKLHE